MNNNNLNGTQKGGDTLEKKLPNTGAGDSQEISAKMAGATSAILAPDPEGSNNKTAVSSRSSGWDKLISVKPEQIENKYLNFLVQRCVSQGDTEIVTHVYDYPINQSDAWMETIAGGDLDLGSNSAVRARIFAHKPATVTAYQLSGVYYDDGSAIGSIPFFPIHNWRNRMFWIAKDLGFDDDKMSRLIKGTSEIEKTIATIKREELARKKEREEREEIYQQGLQTRKEKITIGEIISVKPGQVEDKYLNFLVQRCVSQSDTKIVTHVYDYPITRWDSWMQAPSGLEIPGGCGSNSWQIFSKEPIKFSSHSHDDVFYDDGSTMASTVPFFAIQDWQDRMIDIGYALGFDDGKISKLREGISKIERSVVEAEAEERRRKEAEERMKQEQKVRNRENGIQEEREGTNSSIPNTKGSRKGAKNVGDKLMPMNQFFNIGKIFPWF